MKGKREEGRGKSKTWHLVLLFPLPWSLLFPVFPDRPPLAHTGGFGEPTCHSCHFESPLNDPAGSLSLHGVPEHYRPDSTYRLTVRLVRPGMGRGGFQLAARFAQGPAAGRQAGSLRARDQHVDVADTTWGAGRVAYARHTHAGSEPAGSDTIRWVVQWRAPAGTVAPVIFHVSANAANDDQSELGDFIYTMEQIAAP